MKDLHIYLRVSSETQMTDGFGIENQRELGLSISKSKDMNPIIHNEGSQSSHLDTIDHRPILRNLLLKIEEGEGYFHSGFLGLLVSPASLPIGC